MIWGFAGPWYGQFLRREGEVVRDEREQLYRKLEFLQEHGLQCTGTGLNAIAKMPEPDRERLSAYLEENRLHLTLYAGLRYLEASAGEIQESVDRIAADLARYAPVVRCPLVVTVLGGGHRFDRRMPWEERRDRFARALRPLAAAVHDAGLRLGVENHGDYYVSDLVEVCERAPHLGIFLDTGNTYLIGERPLPAFHQAAPFVVGTHFKDHRVAPRPEARPLHFEIAGAVLGEGDVLLRECYGILRQNTPAFQDLVMEIEMICPDGMDPNEAMTRSVKFVRGLESGAK